MHQFKFWRKVGIQLTLFDMDHYSGAPEASELVTMDAGINSKPTSVRDTPSSCSYFSETMQQSPSAIDAFKPARGYGWAILTLFVHWISCLEILPKDAEQASALQALSQTLGCRRDQVMAPRMPIDDNKCTFAWFVEMAMLLSRKSQTSSLTKLWDGVWLICYSQVWNWKWSWNTKVIYYLCRDWRVQDEKPLQPLRSAITGWFCNKCIDPWWNAWVFKTSTIYTERKHAIGTLQLMIRTRVGLSLHGYSWLCRKCQSTNYWE